MPASNAQQLLDLPLPPNESGAATVRGYLTELLIRLWEYEDRFSGKRPFGMSGWQYDLYVPMIRAGLVEGTFDADDELVRFDDVKADELVLAAIREMGAVRG